VYRGRPPSFEGLLGPKSVLQRLARLPVLIAFVLIGIFVALVSGLVRRRRRAPVFPEPEKSS
jgi:hypothetical protein